MNYGEEALEWCVGTVQCVSSILTTEEKSHGGLERRMDIGKWLDNKHERDMTTYRGDRGDVVLNGRLI